MDEGQLARGYRLRVMGETKRAINRGWFVVDCVLKWGFEAYVIKASRPFGTGKTLIMIDWLLRSGAYFFLNIFFRETPAIPKRPVPNSSMVAGSGTGAAATSMMRAKLTI